MSQASGQPKRKHHSSNAYTPPPANLVELQTLDDLRRAWREMGEARAYERIAMSPHAKGVAAARVANAEGMIKRAHRALDELFREGA